jgi:dolichol-phosphate mannosyltransferase
MLFSAPAENASEDASGPDSGGSGVEAALLSADLNGRAADRPKLSVVIPTRNEERNVEPLLDQLGEVFDPARTEIIFMDDSDDRTPELIAVFARACPVHVRLVQRPPTARNGGLSGAVVIGARHARGDWVLVMDADLQHPPETAAMLARTAVRYNCDLVIGTRYAGDACADGLDGGRRTLVSSWTTRLLKTIFPRRLAMASDPLSGLFAFRKAAVDLDKLRPMGFKILLEIMVRNPVSTIAEVAYSFGPRYAGESKASFRQGMTFLRQVITLRSARLATQLRTGPKTRSERFRELLRFVAFGAVGASGLVVNTAALWIFYRYLGLNHLIGVALATQASTTWNFVLVDSLVYRRNAHGSRLGRAIRFFAMNNLLLLARLPVIEILVATGMGVFVANGVTLTLLFLVRFVLSDRAIFRSATQESRDPVRVLVDMTVRADQDGTDHGISSGKKRSRYLAYRYDVGGVVTIGSQILLPEMEYFRAQQVAYDELDITVRVGDVGARTPRRRAAMTEHTGTTAIRYEEHLGRIGANFRARLGDDRIDVEVGPLLARSSHVVYTNIIEPLLRFVMVSRGHMLVHAACVDFDGTGIMLSALTDTGKTGTVLRLVREHGCRFLSDDMTLIDAEGHASCYPKPLTISAHTLRAVSAEDLTRAEWRRLQIQSRLHSKSGRSIAMALSRFNLPIMGINALTQMLIPPPKYTVDRLVPCHMTPSTKVSELFIIERGKPCLADLDHQSALERLIVNTDDAYGFPPFRHLAPAITIAGMDYHELRAAERQILDSFLSHVRVRTLASNTFSWADDILRLLQPVASLAPNGPLPGEPARVPAVSPLFEADGTPVDAVATAAARLTLAAVGSRPQAYLPAAGSDASAPPDLPVRRAELVPGAPSGRLGTLRTRLIAALAVTAVAVPAVALRLWHINALGFNSDEAVYAGQGASIAGAPELSRLFPVFRAHPLLFQLATSLMYRMKVSDYSPRLLAVAFGLATVAAGYALGARVYGRRAGAITALLLAVMPYLVVVNRQALLDGPMAFFSVLGLWFLARFAAESRRWLLYAAGASLGLAFISKETAIVLLPAAYAFLAVTPSVRVRLKEIAVFFCCFATVALPYPVSLLVAGGSSSGKHFLTWQLFRPANHVWTFYPAVVPPAIGIPVIVAGAGMLALAVESRRWSWRESLLICWIAVPFMFFQLWPVKGFQYLLPVAAPCAVLAAGLLASPVVWRTLCLHHARMARAVGAVATAAVAASLALLSWSSISAAGSTSFLAGTGGVPGGREAGAWIRSETPTDAEMLSIGPSMANILEFYGHREVLGISVSPNPLHRNPAYTPVSNPDLLLRTGQVQYIAWDAYSAARSPFFSRRLMTYVRRYRGSVVYTGTVRVATRDGTALRPVIVIYEVRP